MGKGKYRKINSQLPVHKIYKKFNSDLCSDDMTFHDCELEILRNAVDESEKIRGTKIANSDEVKNLLKIVEDFLIRKKLICYGGTAINNILPKYAQFYNRDLEVPDYDFYSANALDDAKELADIYHKEGYTDVEAKSGVHYGTFKVFVNYIPIADITFLHPSLYNSIFKDTISIAGIHYAPPNFLRMSMYLELSRPFGDVSRWEKVFKRLALLNKYYPLKSEKNCNSIDFQRKMDSDTDLSEKLYISTRNSFIDQGVIFFGGYATSLYSKYMPEDERKIVKKIPDFDVLSEEPSKCATILKETLIRDGFKNVKVIEHLSIGEIIPMHFEIRVGLETIAYVYKPIACHSYNKITIDDREINIATIDTILTFYLSFLYIDNKYYNKDRLLCMAKFLFEVEDRNRLAQTGLLKRFSINCYGKQLTLEDIRSEKAEKFKELSNKRNTKEYEMWFLKYEPENNSKKSSRIDIEKPLDEKIKKLKTRRKVEKIPSIIELIRKKQRTKKNTGEYTF
jgi:hypothetical protein